MTEQGKVVLLTEREAKVLWEASFSQHAKTFKNYCAELRERGLIAPEPEPVDPLLVEAGNICEAYFGAQGASDTAREYRPGGRYHREDDAEMSLALAALRRGKELGQAAARPLTREMSSADCAATPWPRPAVARLLRWPLARLANR